MVVFCNLVGVDIAPVSKKNAVKVKVIGLKPGYLLKSFLLYIPDYDAAVADGDDV